ncbi:MAG TPA: alpha/beta hydrolase [Opitutaceae bacterium]|nr:alpha/beta hydrolase [Opitutaceae bacterium]
MTKRSLLGILFCVQLVVTGAWAAEPPVIPLWPGDVPGSEGKTGDEKVRITPEDGEHVVSSVHRPSLTVYLPAAGKNTGAAVVICPGGGHRELWMDHEGYSVARWLADHGIAAVVLKYRLAREEGSTYQIGTHSFADLQRATRLVRSRAKEWKIDPVRVGVMGFSAGGELAAMAGMKSDGRDADAADPIEREHDRPAFQALIYPGNSGAIAPKKDSPPAFLVAGYGDRPDISEGLARVYLRFKEAGVPAELHIYTGTGHGFGVRPRNKTPSAAWPERFREWLGDRGFLAGTP